MSPAYYKKAKHKRDVPAVKPFQADEVWAAAAAAYRINGEYVKAVPRWATPDPNAKTSNRNIILELLDNPAGITHSDREQGSDTRRYYQSLTFKILQNRRISDYERNAMKVSEKDEIEPDGLDLNLIASLPANVVRAKERDKIENRIVYNADGVIGSIGERISVEIEVLKSAFSINWGVYYITGITTENQVVYFGYKNDVQAGKIIKVTGRVKAHRDNSTQLNRVRIG